MKIDLPNKIAICFVGSNPQRTQEQIDSLQGLKDKFELELWARSDKSTAPNYHSFSQIINEATCETESEFMVYINPKTNATVEQVEGIIEDLCSGLCWSAKVAFGLFGTTKQLYRRIGLMDERFIGGEYEDDDFSLRLKKFGKAVRWEFHLQSYPWDISPLPSLRGSTATIFRDKWMMHDHDVYSLNQIYAEEKMMQPRLQNRTAEYIENSWLDWDQTKTDDVSHVSYRMMRASFKDLPVKTTLQEYTINLNLTNDELYVELLGEMPTVISIQLTDATIGGEIPLHQRIELKSNTWARTPYLKRDAAQIRIYHTGEKIYHNMYVKPDFSINLKIGLKVNYLIFD